MSDALEKPPSEQFRELLGHWHREEGRRAHGGWWSMAGFSFQTSLYVLRLFQGLEGAATDPGALAETEMLSDLLFSQDGRFRLIQVKRTLERKSLNDALKEAYQITALCRRVTPSLLGRLSFQIACRHRRTPLQVDQVPMQEAIGDTGDPATWQAMLGRFESDAPVIEDADTLNQLYLYLWNHGILDPIALIEDCMGCMLRTFDAPTADRVQALGRDLNNRFRAAPRRGNWQPIGKILTKADVEVDPASSTLTGVLTGQLPRLEHLRKGYFRDRPVISDQLWEAFISWLESLEPSGAEPVDRVPVFWIGGRSGEGKSVLLLQLIARFLTSSLGDASLIQLKSGSDLPRLLTLLPEDLTGPHHRHSKPLVVIDDVYNLVRERDDWDDDIREACSLHVPHIAVLTCGPTEQLEQFRSRLSDQFEVTGFEIPQIGIHECEEFLAWYTNRTGVPKSLDAITTYNTLLVLVMFELVQGQRLSDFAKRFRRRLEALGIFDDVRAILAVNALYLDAPLEFIERPESRDALLRLGESDQLHFVVSKTGKFSGAGEVRLAHPHLAWLLFVEWVDPPTTVAKAWARQLARVLIFLESRPFIFQPRLLIHRLRQSRYVTEARRYEDRAERVDRREVLEELYRIDVANHGGAPSASTILAWLIETQSNPETSLDPDPVPWALRWMADPVSAERIHPSIVLALWQLGDSGSRADSAELVRSAQTFALRQPRVLGLGHALFTVYTTAKDEGSRAWILQEWLSKFAASPEAFQVLENTLTATRENAQLFGHATAWLDANESHPRVRDLLIALVANYPQQPGVFERATAWLDANEGHSGIKNLLRPLIRATGASPAIIDRALQFPETQLRETLARALAENPRNTLSYLNGDFHESRKLQACEALVTGLRRDSDAFATYLFSDLNQLAAGPLEWIIRGVVEQQVESDSLNAVIGKWLDQNFRSPAYYDILRVLTRDPGRWARIDGLGFLPYDIGWDYDDIVGRGADW